MPVDIQQRPVRESSEISVLAAGGAAHRVGRTLLSAKVTK
jgi:hypothetical protein